MWHSLLAAARLWRHCHLLLLLLPEPALLLQRGQRLCWVLLRPLAGQRARRLPIWRAAVP
jgi:hypothetical protein